MKNHTDMKDVFFPEAFINVMIVLSLFSIAVASVVLIVLLIKDIIQKKLW